MKRFFYIIIELLGFLLFSFADKSNFTGYMKNNNVYPINDEIHKQIYLLYIIYRTGKYFE